MNNAPAGSPSDADAPDNTATSQRLAIEEVPIMLLPGKYFFDPGALYWEKADAKCSMDFRYSDGSAAEAELLEVVRGAKDVGAYSEELVGSIHDWVSYYHLSPTRANLLYPFRRFFQGKHILELGAGCGGLTPYLAEAAKSVTAIEGSSTRARILAARTRQCNNVTVVCGRAEVQEFSEKFDVVTLIGVLEYARLYLGPRGTQILLSKCREFLKPDGVLVVAIENQLGLKYLLGAPEDHLWRRMAGLTGSYGADTVITFGKTQLWSQIQEAGFERSTFYYPFPNYKAPTVLLSDMTSDQAFSGTADDLLLSVAKRQWFEPPPYTSTQQVWQFAHQNGVLPDLANSFLVFSSKAELDLPAFLAAILTTDRRRKFAKQTTFARCGSSIKVAREYLYGATSRQFDDLSNHIVVEEPLIEGRSYLYRLFEILGRTGWTLREIVEWYRKWWQNARICLFPEGQPNATSVDSIVSGRVIDLIPANTLVGADGCFCFIDQEWAWDRDVPLGYVLVRGLWNALGRIDRTAEPAQGEPLRVSDIVSTCLGACGLEVSETNYRIYVDLENGFLSAALISSAPMSYNDVFEWCIDPHVDLYDNAEFNRSEARRERDEASRAKAEAEIARKELTLARQEAEVARQTAAAAAGERDLLSAEYRRAIESYENSTSWRLTRPLRNLSKFIRG